MRPAQGLGAPAASPRTRRLYATGQAAVLVFAPLWILQWAQLASALDRHAPGVMSGRQRARACVHGYPAGSPRPRASHYLHFMS
jgi:hypothetical protein